MTDEPEEPPNDRETARQNRLREALRENLKRRKSQARGRSGPAGVSEHGDMPGPQRGESESG
jgi:hypothetical protein